MISEVALAILSMMVIMIGVGSCIYNTVLWLKISAECERTEKLHKTIVQVLRNKGRHR